MIDYRFLNFPPIHYLFLYPSRYFDFLSCIVRLIILALSIIVSILLIKRLRNQKTRLLAYFLIIYSICVFFSTSYTLFTFRIAQGDCVELEMLDIEMMRLNSGGCSYLALSIWSIIVPLLIQMIFTIFAYLHFYSVYVKNKTKYLKTKKEHPCQCKNKRISK